MASQGYTAEQLQVIRAIAREAKRRGASRRQVLAAYTIGRVESNFTNPQGGDADSAGWRQERRSLYSNPTNITASVRRVFDELAQHDRGQSVGELAADVQRPAAQYRSRYAQHLAEARKLAGGSAEGGAAVGAATAGRIVSGKAPTFTPAKTETDTKSALVDALLEPGTGGLLKRWQSRIRSGQYTATTPAQVTSGSGDRYVGGKQAAPGAPKGKAAGQVFELFWNGPGAVNIKNGKRVGKGFVEGHADHVHFAAPLADLRRAAKLARSMNLSVREFAPYDKVDAVHSKTSWHYKNRAMDVSGTRMAEFARRIANGDY